MGNDTTLIVAFLAGIVSFLSPCVLPLIPGFLSYLAGASLQDTKSKRGEIFLTSVFFVLGFSVIFSALGVLLNTVLTNVAYDVQQWLARIGGVIIIFFGLYAMGLIKISFLQQEHKLHVTRKFNSRYLTAFVFGAAFAVGWTPCVGAVLGGILALAVSQPGSAFSLLFSYTLGLGLPFLVLGLFTAQAAKWIHKYGPLLKYVMIVFGAILVMLGILIFTDNLSKLANFDLLNQWLLN